MKMSQIMTLTWVPDTFADIVGFLFSFPLPAYLLALMASSHTLTYFSESYPSVDVREKPPFH